MYIWTDANSWMDVSSDWPLERGRSFQWQRGWSTSWTRQSCRPPAERSDWRSLWAERQSLQLKWEKNILIRVSCTMTSLEMSMLLDMLHHSTSSKTKSSKMIIKLDQHLNIMTSMKGGFKAGCSFSECISLSYVYVLNWHLREYIVWNVLSGDNVSFYGNGNSCWDV